MRSSQRLGAEEGNEQLLERSVSRDWGVLSPDDMRICGMGYGLARAMPSRHGLLRGKVIKTKLNTQSFFSCGILHPVTCRQCNTSANAHVNFQGWQIIALFGVLIFHACLK